MDDNENQRITRSKRKLLSAQSTNKRRKLSPASSSSEEALDESEDDVDESEDDGEESEDDEQDDVEEVDESEDDDIDDDVVDESEDDVDEVVDDIDDDVEDDVDEDKEKLKEYFKKDTTKLRQTIIKHVLAELSKHNNYTLHDSITKGVDVAFELFDELIVEKYKEDLIEKIPTRNLWKLGLSPSEIAEYSEKLKPFQTRQQVPVTIQRVLDARMAPDQKRKLLRYFDSLQGMETNTPEYIELETSMNAIIHAANNNPLTTEQEEFITKKEQELKKILDKELPLKIRILLADMDDQRKAAIYEKYLLLHKTPDDSVTAASLEEWIEEALKTPFTTIQSTGLDSGTVGETLIQLKQSFQQHLSELDTVLEPLLTIFTERMVSGNDASSLVIGLLGAPGTGKTATGKVIAEAWGLPFRQISLGGMLDSSILDGQHPGWVGSNPGRFVKALQDMGAVNGVLFLDEVDKLGETDRGRQVQYSLLHSTDPIQNSTFHDHYLGPKLTLDLSKCLIICALNKTEGLDPALLNRMHIVKVPDYTPTQKTAIMLKHLFPNALKDAGLTTKDVTMDEQVCGYIQQIVEQHAGKEGGVRGVKACIKIIIGKLNLLLQTSTEEQEQLKLSFKLPTNAKRPIVITPTIVELLYTPTTNRAAWKDMFL